MFQRSFESCFPITNGHRENGTELNKTIEDYLLKVQTDSFWNDTLFLFRLIYLPLSALPNYNNGVHLSKYLSHIS